MLISVVALHLLALQSSTSAHSVPEVCFGENILPLAFIRGDLRVDVNPFENSVQTCSTALKRLAGHVHDALRIHS